MNFFSFPTQSTYCSKNENQPNNNKTKQTNHQNQKQVKKNTKRKPTHQKTQPKTQLEIKIMDLNLHTLYMENLNITGDFFERKEEHSFFLKYLCTPMNYFTCLRLL